MPTGFVLTPLILIGSGEDYVVRNPPPESEKDGVQMNEVNETIREINNTIGYFKKKKKECDEMIKELEEYKEELMKKYNIEIK